MYLRFLLPLELSNFYKIPEAKFFLDTHARHLNILFNVSLSIRPVGTSNVIYILLYLTIFVCGVVFVFQVKNCKVNVEQ